MNKNITGYHSLKVKTTQLCLTVCYPVNSPGQSTRVGSLSLTPRDLPNPGIKPRSLTFQTDSLPAEPQGKHSQS